MPNLDLAQRIKVLRNRKGISQDVLAEESSLSLRTIQRIENNETVPRGDTLKRLAIALNTSPDEIVDWKIQEDQNYLRFMSLSALWFLVFPLLGVIIPLTMWIHKKDKIKNVNELGVSMMNFQITWILLLSFYSLIFLFLILMVNNVDALATFLFSIPLIFLYTYNVIVVIINAIKISNQKSYRYRPAFSFLRK